jgi:hypothetical protein
MHRRLPALLAVFAFAAALFMAPGSAGAAPSLSGARIVAIYFDSPGTDTRTNASLNAEWVKIKNVTSTRKNLTGWSLRDQAGHVFHFPTFRLAAGATVRVHTGHGTDGAANLYWGSGSYIWNNTGDTAYLRNANLTRVSRCSYTAAADPEAFC